MVADIEDITAWDMSPGSNPPTYAIPSDDPEFHPIAYQRGATAIYNKLQRADFSKVPVFRQLVDYDVSG